MAIKRRFQVHKTVKICMATRKIKEHVEKIAEK
jgi:hypothetical protein